MTNDKHDAVTVPGAIEQWRRAERAVAAARRGRAVAEAAAAAAREAAESAAATASAAAAAAVAATLAEESATETAARARATAKSAGIDLAAADTDVSIAELDEVATHDTYRTAADKTRGRQNGAGSPAEGAVFEESRPRDSAN